MRYAPHETLVAPARPSRALWRLGLGIALGITVYYGLIYAAFGALAALRGPGIAQALFDNVFGTARRSSDALWLLASFSAMIAGTLVAANLMHGRGLRSLTGPPRRLLADFTRCLRALALLYAVLWVIFPSSVELTANLSLGRWFALLPLAVAGLLIQTGAEELFFRGYLQQQLAARFRSPLVWIGLPAAFFALGHYLPEETGDNALMATLWAGAFAVAAADLTARTGTLGAAIALHFANNATSVLMVALPGPVSGLALYLYPYSADDPALMPLMLVDFGAIVVSWLACRVALRV